MTDADLDLLTLFAVHTHMVVESYTTPRLQIDSPVPGSGKDHGVGTLASALGQRPVPDVYAVISGTDDPDAGR